MRDDKGNEIDKDETFTVMVRNEHDQAIIYDVNDALGFYIILSEPLVFTALYPYFCRINLTKRTSVLVTVSEGKGYSEASIDEFAHRFRGR